MMQYVFVSSTSNDLRHHRAVVRDVILDLGWHPVMMEHFDMATVAECLEQLWPCHLIVLLVVHPRGWVPINEHHGDSEKSVTALEFEAGHH